MQKFIYCTLKQIPGFSIVVDVLNSQEEVFCFMFLFVHITHNTVTMLLDEKMRNQRIHLQVYIEKVKYFFSVLLPFC